VKKVRYWGGGSYGDTGKGSPDTYGETRTRLYTGRYGVPVPRLLEGISAGVRRAQQMRGDMGRGRNGLEGHAKREEAEVTWIACSCQGGLFKKR